MQDSGNAPANGWAPSGRCAIVVCDIASFDSERRHDRMRRHLREVLYDGLGRSFGECGVPFGRCYREDRGGGFIVVPPPLVDPAVLVSALPDRLSARLRRHNQISSDVARIRLRVAVHSGDVVADGQGIVGTAVNHVSRLLHAPQFETVFRDSDEEVGVIVSADLHHTLIRREGSRVDPDDYVPIDIRFKETETRAWLRKPLGRIAG